MESSDLKLTDFLTIILSATTLLVGLGITIAQSRKSKRQLTISLHQSYWSIENYLKVIAPSYLVIKKWMSLPEVQKQSYREIVLKGWISLDSSSAELENYLGKLIPSEDLPFDHFRKPIGNEFLTEHQSLTVLLYLWSHFSYYYQNNLVNRKLFKTLFQDAFSYKKDFFIELTNVIETSLLKSSREIRPQWLDSLKFLANEFEK